MVELTEWGEKKNVISYSGFKPHVFPSFHGGKQLQLYDILYIAFMCINLNIHTARNQN